MLLTQGRVAVLPRHLARLMGIDFEGSKLQMLKILLISMSVVKQYLGIFACQKAGKKGF